MNNHSIPSTHTERQISDLSVKYSFTPYPSLSPYSQMESLTEKGIHSLRMGWRNFFPVVLLCQFLVLVGYVLVLHTYILRVQYSSGIVLVFWFWREIVFGVRTYLVYNTDVRLCQFFGCGGK